MSKIKVDMERTEYTAQTLQTVLVGYHIYVYQSTKGFMVYATLTAAGVGRGWNSSPIR